jgi:TP901 family phage tail tape measure protein
MSTISQYGVQLTIEENILQTVKEMQAQMGAFNGTLDSVNGRFEAMGRAQKQMGLHALSENFRNANQAIQSFIQPGAAFQQQMHDLEAITGITGTQLEALGTQARKVGIESGLGAAQATEAFKILASNIDVASLGNPEQQTKGLIMMQQAVVSLSQAGEVMMPAAAEAMAGAMNQFGMSADQATKVTDILAAGAKYGAAEIPDLANSIKIAGTTAAQAGISMQEMTGALEVLSQKSIKGSEAGTAMRNVLLKLQTEGIKGVDVKTQGFAGALDHLKGKLGDTTFLAKTFGVENVNAAQILIKNSDAVRTMTAKVDENGVAAQMAAIRMDTYSGKMAMLKAKFDDFAISVFNGTNQWLPYMNMAGGALQTLADFAPALELLKGGYATLATQLGLATGALATHWATTSGLSISTRIMTAAQWAFNTALAANPIGAAVAVMVALGAAVYYAYQQSVTFRATIQALSDSFSALFLSVKPLIDYLAPAFEGFGGTVSTVFSTIIEYTITPFIRRLQAVADFIKGISEALQGNFHNAGSAFVEAGMHALNMETTSDKKSKNAYYQKNGVVGIGEMGGNIANGFKDQFKTKLMPKGNDGKNPKGVNDANDKGKKSEGSGGSTQGAVRHVTVNINSPMIQNYSVHTNNIQEGIKDIQDKVKESLVRIVRDTELSISE